jgi:hypothetical protein
LVQSLQHDPGNKLVGHSLDICLLKRNATHWDFCHNLFFGAR